MTTTVLNTKATEIENKKHDTTNLAAKVALHTQVEEIEVKYLILLNKYKSNIG